jgi:hypothetical protein
MREPKNMVAEAERLLGLSEEDPTPDMIEFLEEVETFCRSLGGEIASRQIVALAVATYRHMQKVKGFATFLVDQHERDYKFHEAVI